MNESAALIAKFTSYYLFAFLLRKKEEKISIIESVRVRLPQNLNERSFSDVDFLAVFLEKWGEVIDWKFLEKGIPIFSAKERRVGVAELVLIDNKANSDELRRFVTKVVKESKRDIKEKGIILNKEMASTDIILVDLGCGSIEVERVMENDKISIVETRFNAYNEVLKKDSKAFDRLCDLWNVEGGLQRGLDLFHNRRIFWPAGISDSLRKVAVVFELDYLLKKFLKEEQLDLINFASDIERNPCLIIAGERSFLLDDDRLTLLSVAGGLGLGGIFDVYIDQYNLLRHVGQLDRNVKDLSGKSLADLCVKKLGTIVVLEDEQDEILEEEILAEVKVEEGAGEKDLFPMKGRVIEVQLDGKSVVDFKLAKGIKVKGQKEEFSIKAENSLIVDSRNRPMVLPDSLKALEYKVLDWIG